MGITRDMHNWVVAHVMGSCDFGHTHRLDFNRAFGITDENDETFDQALEDAEVFLCGGCGWYCEFSEQSEDGDTCTDCFEEYEGSGEDE